MSQITIVQIDNQLVVDSRDIAEQLDIQHESFMKLIKKHQATIEAEFGRVGFEIRPDSAVSAYLNEDQSIFLMTLSRNTEKVIKCKVGLVKAFSAQKKQLEDPIDRSLLNELADRIAKLETTTPRPALPPASVDPIPQPIEPLTERALINRLIRSYVHNQTSSQPKTEQDIYRWVYLELKYRYHYDVYARVKKSGIKCKLDQVAADDKMTQLLAICNHFLN